MRHDESQKADGADHRGGNPGKEYGDHRNDNPASCYTEAETSCRFIFQRQQIALSQHEYRGDQPDDRIDKQRSEIVPCFHSDVGVDNACRAGIAASCAGLERTHQPSKHSVDRHAYKNNAQRRQPALIREAVNQKKSDHAAEKCEQRGEKIQCGKECGNKHGGKACAAADTDNSGIGKGIFHYRLQEHSGNGGRRAAQHGDENSGKTEIKDRRYMGVIFNKQSFKQIRRRYLQTAGIDGKEKKRQKSCGCNHKG